MAEPTPETPPAPRSGKGFRPVMLLPIALLLFIPVTATGWVYFYYQQRATLVDARSPDTAPQDLEKLARKGNLDVKMAVATNPSTPSDAVDRLAEDPTLRYFVIFERDAPASFVRAVAVDERSKRPMLVAAAGHKNAPVDALDALSGHPDPAVRVAVARNPKVRQEILNRLAGDDHDDVATAARDTLDSRAP